MVQTNPVLKSDGPLIGETFRIPGPGLVKCDFEGANLAQIDHVEVLGAILGRPEQLLSG